MARSKWISFGAQQNLERAAKAAAATATATSRPVQSPADAKKFGLENFGNTCYANSVLQALYFCTPFRDLLLQELEPLQHPNSSPVIPPTPTKPPPPLTPVRRKPERKPSSTGQPGELSSGVAQNVPHPIPSSPPTLISALRSLFLNISTNPGDKGTVAPRAFIDKLKELNELFRSTMHQDAHEFLNYLLNQIVEETEGERKQALNGAHTEDLSSSVQTLGSRTPATVSNSSNSGRNPQDATLVHRLFQGVLTSETRCLTCETISSRDESFLDLSIDIEQNSSVTACLRQFSASEMLCQRNKFFCDSCCDLQEAEKRMKIKKLPNVLALHLKRFKYQEDVGRYIKLAYRVAFPFELRLFNTVDDMDDADRLYNLFAIVVHIGNGPHHGHYISIIKTFGTWLVFDDDNVYPLPESDIPKYFGDSNSGSAYVLYYQAVDIDLPALGLRPPTPQAPSDKLSNVIPPFERSPVISSHVPVLPPGLNHIDVDPSQSQPIVDILPTPPPSETPDDLLSTPITLPIPSSTDHSPQSSQSLSASPVTPGGFVGLINSIRRAPSLSATRANHASSNNEHRGSTTERSPGFSASVPSFVASSEGSYEAPPPMPPLPAGLISAPHPPPHTAPIAVPDTNEPEKEEKEKSKSGGWLFTKKRKSIRISNKAKAETVFAPDLPPSPVVAREEDGHHSSHWFNKSTGSTGSGTPRIQRRPSESGAGHAFDAAALHPDSVRLKTPNGDRRMNGYDDSHSPGSGSSSPSSNSLLTNGQGTVGGGSTTRPSTSVSSTGSAQLDLAPTRKPAFVPPSVPISFERASIDRKKSLDLRALSSYSPSTTVSPSLSTPAPDYQHIPPLPSTPKHNHTGRPNSSNGHVYVSDPDNLLLKGKSRSTEPDTLSPLQPFAPQVILNHVSPPALATSAGANTSSGSSSSAASNFKRATRKLSLTAPMLGFGRRDKDRDKEKAREREKDRVSPSAYNAKF